MLMVEIFAADPVLSTRCKTRSAVHWCTWGHLCSQWSHDYSSGFEKICYYSFFYYLHPVRILCSWLYFLQIVDRPSVADQVLGQFYVQPQWVFDSINRFRIPTDSRLFAHLSRPWSNGWVALSFLFVRRPSRYGDIFSSSTSTCPRPPNPYIFWKLMIIAIQKWIRNTNTKTKTNTKTMTKTKTPRE